MTKYEYCYLEKKPSEEVSDFINKVNQLGQQGWRVIDHIMLANQFVTTLLLERPLN